MTASTTLAPPPPLPPLEAGGVPPTDRLPPITRRDSSTIPFDGVRITRALTRAFVAVEGSGAGTSSRVREIVSGLHDQVVGALRDRVTSGRPLHVEEIQDQVELALMRAGHHPVARAYVLYREERARARAAEVSSAPENRAPAKPPLHLRLPDGSTALLDPVELRLLLEDACAGLPHVDPEALLEATLANLYDGISVAELGQAAILAARSRVETEPNHSRVAARLLLRNLLREGVEAVGIDRPEPYRPEGADSDELYRRHFAEAIRMGIRVGTLDPELERFDLERLAGALRPERDRNFEYLGLQTLYDRYLLQHEDRRYELPQGFFMRIAMGLALREVDREARAEEFYEVLSSFRFMCSTPTLFNAGTLRPQLSSCFLTTLPDDLHGIYRGITDNALLSKYAGGLGNDWTRVRGLGARIRGTNGKSQGVIPFLKVANDTAVAVNQGGKRKGAACAYLETWHIDVEDFLELRKNTGDDRRRTHDMNTAHWIPDLFMERVEADGEWTLVSPDEAPDLHELTGEAFRRRYEEVEAAAARGELRVHRTVRAQDLWRRMLTALFETGHPWITFKDPCNFRSPQQHVGVVHSSNLCTEITLNTSDDEVAVCNLGSVNLAAHLDPEGIDEAKIERTVRTAMRMLDNVIDQNFYTIPQARRSNLRHRPVGLGIMGFQDALHRMGISYASEAAVEFADESMEILSYHAISASVELAAERGTYPTFEGSLWSRGILPIDSVELLAEARGGTLEVDRTTRLDWSYLRERVRTTGIRNSNLLAIAPTATIANICGVSPSIEPVFRNLYVKSNLSGEFTVVNPHLVEELRERGLWDEVMVSDLKYYDGSLAPIDRVPPELKDRFATAFEVHGSWLVEAAARRQKWIDQAQSLNLYIAEPDGARLDALYRLAWSRGLKTTYYLRSRSATRVEKSTLAGTDGRLNAVTPVPRPAPTEAPSAPSAACTIDDPDCEACQ